MPDGAQEQEIVHASCVTYLGKSVLIRGAAGSGKSSLALQLMAFGATLVSDDQTILARHEDTVQARAPEPIQGLIEARGIGILNGTPGSFTPAPPTSVFCVIDMDEIEVKRLPFARETLLLGIGFPCLHKVASPAFPAAVLQYLRGGLHREI